MASTAEARSELLSKQLSAQRSKRHREDAFAATFAQARGSPAPATGTGNSRFLMAAFWGEAVPVTAEVEVDDCCPAV